MTPARERAAKALDLTHQFGERGPRIFMARNRIATALDKGTTPAVNDVKWLETVVRKENRNGMVL